MIPGARKKFVRFEKRLLKAPEDLKPIYISFRKFPKLQKILSKLRKNFAASKKLQTNFKNKVLYAKVKVF